MKEFFLIITILISTSAFATKPLPEECQEFIKIGKKVSTDMAQKDPSLAKEVNEMLAMLDALQQEWDKLQALTLDPNLDEEKKKIAQTMQEMGEVLFTDQCAKGVQKIKTQLIKAES